MDAPLTTLNERFTTALTAAFGPEYAEVDPLIAPAQNPRFGDYQANVAMSLAKSLKQKPRDVAAALIEHLDLAGICEAPQIAGPGFINLTCTTDYLARIASSAAADEHLGVQRVEHPKRVVVDYSSPNVAKQMHVGHLRSTVIGDALARTLEFLGHKVTRQNHVGDWGTQFGMLIENLIEQGGLTDSTDLTALYKQAKQRFDDDEDFARRARQRVVSLQAGDSDTVEIWQALVNASYTYFQHVYNLLNVSLSVEDIRGESAYNHDLADTVGELEAAGLTRESDGATCIFMDQFKGADDEPLPLIIRKSDGGYLYATTDLAAIRYRVHTLEADRVIYVTDARQKQHFAMVFAAAQRAGWVDEHIALEHVTFGTVLGEDNKPFKTRSGDTIRLIDLLEEAQQRAAGIVAEKNAELSPDEQQQVAKVVGIGAVKYADLSGDRVKDYVFSWDRMLAMDGNTAPYLQYAYTRIRSIFRKAPGSQAPTSDGASVEITHDAERALVLKLLQFGPTVGSVSDTLQPHRLCNYLYELASQFSSFYENCPVLRADSDQQRDSRLTLCDLTARTLKQGLGLLGIDVLERM